MLFDAPGICIVAANGVSVWFFIQSCAPSFMLYAASISQPGFHPYVGTMPVPPCRMKMLLSGSQVECPVSSRIQLGIGSPVEVWFGRSVDHIIPVLYG